MTFDEILEQNRPDQDNYDNAVAMSQRFQQATKSPDWNDNPYFNMEDAAKTSRNPVNRVFNENDLKIQQIRVDQIKKDIQNAYEILPQLTVRSTIPGIFQITRNWRSGQLLQVGDEVWRGNAMASVPDLTWMKVETQINENDFLRIKEGDKVLVRLDALPEVAFEGYISTIGLFCHAKDPNKPRQKAFDVEVRLLVSDERLKPGMTVSCEFLPSQRN